MPLFSSGRADNRSVEYSAVETGQMHVADSDHARHSALDHGLQSNRPSVDINDTDVNTSHNSTVLNSEGGRISNDKASCSYSGPTINGWPTAPRKLRGFSVPLLIGDILLILLPIAFLALGICAWQLDGKTLSGTGRMVERAMNLGPTIYPLAFAAIGSRCLRSTAVRLAERGTTISTLEKLLGSQSLVSAIGTACTLRSANVISIGLLLLWGLSPLGGQSSLRLLHRTNATISERGTIYYSDHAAPIDLDEAGSWLAVVPTILTASLSSSAESKNRPLDSWNHPKVPRLELIEQQALQDPSSEGSWVDVDPLLNHTYSSWTGINVQNLRQTESADFQVKYNYMYLDCRKSYTDTPENVLISLFASDMVIFPPLSRTSPDEDAGKILDFVGDFVGSAIGGIDSMSFLLRAVDLSNSTHKKSESMTPQFNFTRQPISYLYGAMYIETSEPVFQMYTCSPYVVTVDAQIRCQADDCSVSRLRHVPGESSSSLEGACDTGPVKRLGCMTSGTYTVHTFLRYFPAMVASVLGSSAPFDDWITGINKPYSLGENRIRDQVTDREKSNRLSTLLNTYWQGAAWGYQVTRAEFFEKPEYLDAQTWGDSRSPSRWVNVTDAIFSHPVPIYRADVGWIISLLLITMILLLLGIANVVISFMTIAPDLFYYASSLARENPYTDTPDRGTALDGAERSRLLKTMKVQVADVSPENEVGYVVLKSVGAGDDFQTGRLKKGRLYW